MRVLSFLIGAAAIASAAGAQAPGAPVERIVPLKPHFYMVTGAGGNVTVFAADHGLILVDDKNAGQANFDGLVAAVLSVSDLPVMAVFNTHHHGDHIGNNDRFLDAKVMVVGNENMPAELARGAAAGATPPASPNVLFSQDFSLILAGGRVDAHHYGPGHTADDTIVYFPTGKIVAAGDLLNGGTPTIDYAGGANLGGWIASLDQVLKLDFDLAIPGHGDKPMSRADVIAFRAKMATFLDRARAVVKSGTHEADLIDRIHVADLGWKWNANSWPQARLDGLWAEAGGAGAAVATKNIRAKSKRIDHGA